MDLIVDLQGKNLKVVFSEKAIDQLMEKSFPLIKINDILQKHKAQIECSEINEEFVIVDDLVFKGKKTINEIVIEKIIK